MHARYGPAVRRIILYALVVPALAVARPVSVSPDITVNFAGEVVNDEDVAIDDQAGGVILPGSGALPAGADLTAYHALPNGDLLMAFDITLTLGSETIHTGDVVRFDGNDYTLEFEASAQGGPAGAKIDALASNGSDLLLSFDTTVSLSGETFDDADLVQITGAGFVRFFDSAGAGVPPGMDLDAAAVDADGLLYLSFDISGSLGGIDFDDEDVLEFATPQKLQQAATAARQAVEGQP